ncbi:MAG: enoyl-CoA hydratase/isomerase family protein [Sphingobium sp.]|nr:enoyl-CoA hydratase/isomerase family protein [Sphingobium sp.]
MAHDDSPLPTNGSNTGPSFQTLRFERSGSICTITLNRPEADNIANAQMLNELPLAWEAFRADDTLSVAIFTAAGDEFFCGGIDSAVFRQDGPPPAYLRRDEGIRRYTAKQNKCWKPVIAAVNGLVVGPGLHFLLDADICIAVEEARFCDAHMHRTGSVPIIEPIEMARRVPHEAVSRMFLLGPHDPIDAARAYSLGLISEIAARERLMTRATEMAQQIAQADMHLTMAFVESLYKARELGVTEAINRGLIIRQLAGYRPAPLNGLPLGEIIKS